ncbi:hypothetical protein TNCV_2953851 [Trichonephila clavipes]|nr:hypothetical protein TNCV_2953851 [Trichonephila clavipes]
MVNKIPRRSWDPTCRPIATNGKGLKLGEPCADLLHAPMKGILEKLMPLSNKSSKLTVRLKLLTVRKTVEKAGSSRAVNLAR